MGSSRMNMARIAMLVLWVYFLFFTCEAGRHTDLKHQLQSVKENTIKTITTSVGEIFDCVDINKQPGLAHPKLKDHKIQMMPTSMSLNRKEQSAATTIAEDEEVECPPGSVPIQRLELDNLLKENLPTKPEPLSPRTSPIPHMDAATAPYKRFWAIMRSKKKMFQPKRGCCDPKMASYGGGAMLNVYSIPNVGPHDISSSLMWIVSEGMGVVLRAGWQARPGRYNDAMSRLFIEWSVDKDRTVCVNNDCPGFVVVSQKPKLGAACLPVSRYMGQQYSISVFIYKDVITGNWWFAVGDKASVVGYWPKDVVKGVPFAVRMDFGGFLFCPRNKKCPNMGNGARPGAKGESQVDHACFVRGIHYYNDQSERVDFTTKTTVAAVTDYSCCIVGKFQDRDQSFTFGGSAY